MWWRNTHPQPRNTQRGAVRSVSSGAHDIRCRTGGMVASQTSSRHSEPRLIGHGRGAGQPGEARRAYGDSRQEPRQRPGRKDTGEERDSQGKLGGLTGTPGRSPDSDPAARCAPLGTVTVTPTKAADRHVPPWLAPPVPTAWKLPERRLQQGSHDTRATATYTWRGRGGWADMSYRERPRRLAVIDHSGCGRRPPAERSGTWAKS
ncbi:MAG: hypothetical protein WDW38_003254 [Sanguina aurantia]